MHENECTIAIARRICYFSSVKIWGMVEDICGQSRFFFVFVVSFDDRAIYGKSEGVDC